MDIGTSDFDTSAELLRENEYVLLVEPVFHYLKNIADRPGVIKAPFAISDHNGYADIYHIPETDISKLGLPDWLRGCNSLGKPHKLAFQEWPHVTQQQLTVPTITFQTLIDVYSIESIRNVKIDTEGHDHVILAQILNFVQQLNIQSIMFEYIGDWNENAQILDQLIEQAKTHGLINVQMPYNNCILTR